MRKIVLNTETTGISADGGHRIVELAAIEIDGREITQNRIHKYFNPEREIDAGASAVHGLTLVRLEDEPTFDDFAHEFAEFIRDAEIIIHNAPFDLGFLNSEFEQAGIPPVENICQKVTDILLMARIQNPGKKNSLKALCERHGVDYSHRTLHGAMLDAELLAEVYLQMVKRELH
jgi:DNA polymerase-3 subunit epsilon